MIYQTTIDNSISLDGINVYNGKKNKVTFHPAEEDTGLVFVLKNSKIPVKLEAAKHAKKAISLDNGQKSVYLVEHLLSGIYALGIDNLVIELSDKVCPTFDYYSLPILEALIDNRVEQSLPKKFWTYAFDEPQTINRKGYPDSLTVKPSDSFVIDYFASYPHKAVRSHHYSIEVNEEQYLDNIAKARSIVFFKNEFFMNMAVQLGKLGFHGGSEKNFLIVGSKHAETYANSEKNKDRYNGEEFVRHKILDVLGTLALTGRHFKNTRFNFHMTGHKFDLKVLKALFELDYFKEYELE